MVVVVLEVVVLVVGGGVIVVEDVDVVVVAAHGFGEHVPGPLSMPPLCWHERGVFSWHFAVPPNVRQHWVTAGVEAIMLGGIAAVSQKKAVAARSVRGTVDMTASALRADEVRVASRNIPFVGLADLEPQYLHQMRYTE